MVDGGGEIFCIFSFVTLLFCFARSTCGTTLSCTRSKCDMALMYISPGPRPTVLWLNCCLVNVVDSMCMHVCATWLIVCGIMDCSWHDSVKNNIA